MFMWSADGTCRTIPDSRLTCLNDWSVRNPGNKLLNKRIERTASLVEAVRMACAQEFRNNLFAVWTVGF